MASNSNSSAASSTSSTYKAEMKKKEALGWMEWLRGWLYLAYEMLFQRITASHLHNPMPLSTLNDITCIFTGSTSGIGQETAMFLLFRLFFLVISASFFFDSD